MYHDICDDPEESGFPGPAAAAYKISVSRFREHMEAIERQTNVKPGSVLDWDPAASSVPPVFLTFDDGGKSAMLAADELETFGWKGHFFVTAGRIGTPGFLTGREIRDLHERGHVIGTHSFSHPPRISRLSPSEIELEWETSLKVLSDHCDADIVTASVPGGFYSRRVADRAQGLGIRFLFTSEPTIRVSEVRGCNVIGRYAVRSAMKSDEAASIVKSEIVPRLKQLVIWNLKKPLKAIGGERSLRMKNAVFEL